ncbi:hypothetical protein FB567DRAFT_555823 [Paraphoma chrysanthemicola]|uniref:Uncharacterized protein n=1 Tax=Paraphoma chrysanthemicola TaxID=798071 RepID=A0A8K0QSM3_9PLEO|nr:hypothetical protein FB567DRAFT_555823 [Paraphoma chrysanthemicola]
MKLLLILATLLGLGAAAPSLRGSDGSLPTTIEEQTCGIALMPRIVSLRRTANSSIVVPASRQREVHRLFLDRPAAANYSIGLSDFMSAVSMWSWWFSSSNG